MHPWSGGGDGHEDDDGDDAAAKQSANNSPPPLKKSRTMYSFSGVWNAKRSETMNGWSMSSRISLSFFVCCVCLRAKTAAFLRIFSAYIFSFALYLRESGQVGGGERGRKGEGARRPASVGRVLPVVVRARASKHSLDHQDLGERALTDHL